jgi:hypothetical protein
VRSALSAVAWAACTVSAAVALGTLVATLWDHGVCKVAAWWEARQAMRLFDGEVYTLADWRGDDEPEAA